MSHYAIAVFSNDQDFDRLLEPYSESNKEEFIYEPYSQVEIDERWEKFSKTNPNWTRDQYLNEFYVLHDNIWCEYYNPHGYYDWYSLDGRSYLFDFKEGYDYEQGCPKKSDYDWYKTEHMSLKKLRSNWKKYSTEGDGFFKAEYYLERYGTEEQYIKEMMRPTVPYAFVTPDGVWHAPGKVGWFALSDETAESMNKYFEEWCDFIDNGPDCYVSLVDCHI